MKTVIAGASGFIGRNLTGLLAETGVSDIVGLERADFQPENRDRLVRKLEQAECVVNLAGAPILGRWTKQYKQQLYDSRIETTRKLVETINALPVKPRLFVSTSASGYYPAIGTYDERDRVSGKNFLASLCRDWEQAARQIDPQVRLVITRFGVVLGRDGGLLPPLRRLFRWYLGGRIGNGRQAFSWIHIDDLMRIYRFLLEHPSLSGVVNCAAPEISDNRSLTALLAKATGRPAPWRYPSELFRLFLGDGADVVVSGQRVRSIVLPEAGFRFDHPTLEEALRNV